MATSIFSRKLDLVYLLFFLIHIPVMFCEFLQLSSDGDRKRANARSGVDLTPLYPAAFKPQFMTDLRAWYIHTYRDQFFTQPPAWFNAYMWMELAYHVPISVWAIGGLLRDDSKVPLHLLVFAVQTAVTTATCVADYLSWSSYTNSEKIELGKLYVPYLALCKCHSRLREGHCKLMLVQSGLYGCRYVWKTKRKAEPYKRWITKEEPVNSCSIAELLELGSKPGIFLA